MSEIIGVQPISNTTGLHKEHYVGAISELKAINYYLSNEYQVFTPVVQQGWADFVVNLYGVGFKKAQVKTATMIQSGNYKYLQCRTRLTNKYKYEPHLCYDILVIVFGDELWEIPAEVVNTSNLCLRSTNPTPRNTEYTWDKYKVR